MIFSRPANRTPKVHTAHTWDGVRNQESINGQFVELLGKLVPTRLGMFVIQRLYRNPISSGELHCFLWATAQGRGGLSFFGFGLCLKRRQRQRLRQPFQKTDTILLDGRTRVLLHGRSLHPAATCPDMPHFAGSGWLESSCAGLFGLNVL